MTYETSIPVEPPRRLEPPRRHMRALLVALSVLGVSSAAAVWLMHLDAVTTLERSTVDAQAGAQRAADGVRSAIAALEAQSQSATTNPRLVAALDADVDQETLRDLLLTEPWWEPFRRAVDGFGLWSDEGTSVVTSHLPEAFDARSSIREARQARRPALAVVAVSGQVVALVACPIALAGRSDWPVLVAIKALDAAMLSATTGRGAGAVAISDGRRLVVAGPQPPPALERAAAASGVSIAGRDVVAVQPLGDGLRILVHVAGSRSGPGDLPLPWPVIVVLIAGITVAIGLYVMLLGTPPGTYAGAAPEAAGGAPAAIGRYALVERIGEGGMAEIYAAVTAGEGSFRRPVVIKRLRPELAVDPKAVAQFCDEANLLAGLHHPNIVAVHDFGRAGNQYFLAEEYVSGRDLGRVVERRFAATRRSLPVEIIAHVGVEMLKALDFAHTRRDGESRPLGIVHRDVSPDNVMVSALGEIKLLDFGVVKAEGRLTKTDMGVVKGNVTYMAPEQARGLEVDARADLYSLALVLYFCCAGRPLYDADTTYGLLMKAGAGPGIEERAAIRQLPRPFAAVIDRATALRIEDRYATARQMADDLEPFARGGTTLAAALVSELFGLELKDEQRRLATFIMDSTISVPGRTAIS
jgi:hypothetical protein